MIIFHAQDGVPLHDFGQICFPFLFRDDPGLIFGMLGYSTVY
jgi:hypothetical protein